MTDFRIEGELGSGAMGTVYRAVHLRLDRPVALKHISAPDLTPEVLARFQREIRLLSGLRHPNIVRFFDTGTLGGRPFFTMELVDGRTLHECIATDGPLPFTRALRLLEQAAEALAYLHERGLCHRDVKPSNLMVDTRDHLTLIDFGLMRNPGGRNLTEPGALLGTPAYMPPEAFLEEPAGPPRDVYALGVTAYEILTARDLFDAADVTEVIPRIMRHELPELGNVVSGIPAWFLELHRSCVDGDAGGRPTAAGLAEALRAGLRDGSIELSLPRDSVSPGRDVPARSGPPTGLAGASPAPSTRGRAPGIAALLALGIGALLLRLPAPAPAVRPLPPRTGMTLRAAGERGVTVDLIPPIPPGTTVELLRPGPAAWRMTRPVDGHRAFFPDVAGGRVVARALGPTGSEIGHTAPWPAPAGEPVRDLLCSPTESAVLVDFVLDHPAPHVVAIRRAAGGDAVLSATVAPGARDFHHVFEGLVPGTEYVLTVSGGDLGPVPFRSRTLEQRAHLDEVIRKVHADFPMTSSEDIEPLVETPDPRVLSPLAERLGSANLSLARGLRQYAWLAARLRSPELVDALLPVLDQDARSPTRRAILMAAVAARHPRAPELLEQALAGGPASDDLASFVPLLARRGGRAACDALAERTLPATAPAELGREVATAMVRCDRDQAVSLFRAWLDRHQQESVARLAAAFSGLGLAALEEDVDRIARHLGAGVPARHEAAVRALVSMALPVAWRRLEEAYRRAPSDLALIWAMGFLDGTVTTTLLRSRLTIGESPEVTEITTHSLVALRDRGSIAVFRGQLDHPEAATRERAAWALALLGDAESAARLQARGGTDQDPRGVAALAAFQLGAPLSGTAPLLEVIREIAGDRARENSSEDQQMIVLTPDMPRARTRWILEPGDAVRYQVQHRWKLPEPGESRREPWTRDARVMASIGEQDVPLAGEGVLIADRPGELSLGAWRWGSAQPWTPMPRRSDGAIVARLLRVTGRAPLADR